MEALYVLSVMCSPRERLPSNGVKTHKGSGLMGESVDI